MLIHAGNTLFLCSVVIHSETSFFFRLLNISSKGRLWNGNVMLLQTSVCYGIPLSITFSVVVFILRQALILRESSASHCVAQVGLELTRQFRLPWNFQ